MARNGYLIGCSPGKEQLPQNRLLAPMTGISHESGRIGRPGGEYSTDKQAAARGPKRTGHSILRHPNLLDKEFSEGNFSIKNDRAQPKNSFS